MSRKFHYYYILTISLLSLSLFMTSCSKNDFIVSIDNSKLTLDDFLYDIYQIKSERDTWNEAYQDALGIDYWDFEFEYNNMESLARDTIMTRVVLNEILYDQAKKAEVSLTDEDESKLEAKSNELIQSMTEDQLEDTGLNYDIIIKTLQKQFIGDKYYQTLLDSFEVNESAIRSNIDPDLYREYKTECLYVPTVLVGHESISPMSQEELTEAYSKILNVQNLIHKGADFKRIPNEIDGVTLYERDFILDDNTAEEEYKNMAITLENGNYSPIVTTEFGYYIICMLNNNSSYRFEKHIDDLILEHKKEKFELYYYQLQKDYEISINNKYWERLSLR